jgi:NAD(P)-dependent dehydrogenase (short-subunit alcohol dehydrogenase family)
MRLTDVGRQLVNYPTGLLGRNRPWYFMNLLDIVNGPRTLEDAVDQRVVMITGASSGIGRETALRVGAAGATTLLVARGVDKLDETRREIDERGGTAFVYPCDLSDLEDIERMAKDVLREHECVDVLVNNAGRSIRRSVELSYERMHDYQRTMQVNYFGPVRLVLSLLPTMRARRSGHIVNISSAGVQSKVPRFSGYVASKAALDAFADCAAGEVHHDGVRFTTVFMPLVRTPMIAPTTIYRRLPAMSSREAADMVCDAIIHRPRRLGTPVGNLATFGNAVSPRSMDAVRNAAYRLFPDSQAARGEDGGVDAEVSVLAQVFGRVGRGVHW